VRTERTFQSFHVIRIGERVVANQVGSELRLVTVRRKRQGGAAAPAAHHLRGDQPLFLRRRPLAAQVTPKTGNIPVELSKRHKGPVRTQVHGNRGVRGLPELVGIAENELAGLDRRVTAGMCWAASLDMRIVQSVLEAEWVAPVR